MDIRGEGRSCRNDTTGGGKEQMSSKGNYIYIHIFFSICGLVFHQQKFDNRKSVVRETEAQYWEVLTLDYMTEESDDESDPNCIVEHKLPWRSNGKCGMHAV